MSTRRRLSTIGEMLDVLFDWILSGWKGRYIWFRDQVTTPWVQYFPKPIKRRQLVFRHVGVREHSRSWIRGGRDRFGRVSARNIENSR